MFFLELRKATWPRVPFFSFPGFKGHAEVEICILDGRRFWRLQFVPKLSQVFIGWGIYFLDFPSCYVFGEGFAGSKSEFVTHLMLVGSLVHFPALQILTQISNQLEVFKKWLRLRLPKSFELRWICCHSRLHSLLTVQVVTKCLEVYSENVTRKTCYFLWPEAFPAWDVGILFGSSWTPSLALPNRRWQQGFANIRFDAIHRGVGWVRWTTSPLGCQ